MAKTQAVIGFRPHGSIACLIPKNRRLMGLWNGIDFILIIEQRKLVGLCEHVKTGSILME